MLHIWIVYCLFGCLFGTVTVTGEETKPAAKDYLVTVELDEDTKHYKMVPDECVPNRVSQEEKLIKDMFEDYDSRSRPKLNSSERVEVKVKFVLMQLNSLDEKIQILATSGWMEVEWQDERLTWSPEDYGNLTSVVVSSQLLWLPDIALQNSASEIYHSSFQDSKFRISIWNTGNILWIPGGKFFTNCELDITYFPFDDQKCMLHFTNWAYTGLQVNLTNSVSVIPLDNYKLNGEWDIVKTKATREDVFFYCCPEVPYPAVYFTIYMRRKFLYHLTNIVTPCLMLSILVAVVFCLPPDDGEKIALGITVLLSFSVFLLLIAESMPRISESVPVISIYLTIFMAMTTVCIFWTVLVLNLHHRTTVTPVPKWLRVILFNCLARMLCMRSAVPDYEKKHHPEENSVNNDEQLTRLTRSDHVGMRLSKRGRGSFTGDMSPCRCITTNHNGEANKDLEKSYSNRLLEEVVDHLRCVTEKRMEEEEIESQRAEWRAAASIVDRFFFLLSLAIIIVSSIVVLVCMPMSKKDITSID
ncbi:neuronal acetylcholine receptor subunit alpha-10 isoform X2 [Lingula anatina]|uniref:Neuronal acetylcholine receptor subunit alpha-10 isoform X2 n=1 Tax=Lingula anatina TaxID=7574 RepID=A0A1S3JGW1_LINAN|nr:neuronal acetylcholine receptor subunit alpha-10 isoform X2 [Lingula anatina]|eukprot:XP_013409593.1 neuronal acetylcholine receptor subunit alpha-10 isoform X2 [Lingula anatina]